MIKNQLMELPVKLLITIISFVVINPKNNFKCVSHERNTEIEIIPKTFNSRNLQTQSFEKIRIHVDYSTLDSQVVNYGQSYISNIKTILGQAVSLFEDILSVQRLNEPLAINSCDSAITKISDIVLNGIQSDIVIFPVIDPSLQSNENSEAAYSILAYASPCKLSGDNFRPVAGIISFSSNEINTNYNNWVQYYTQIAIHELNHIFVFNSSLYSFYVNSQGERIAESQIYKSVLVNGKEKNMIITPKVVQEARNHFDCSSLEGVFLEDQEFVNNSAVSSHWEIKYMLGDIMIGITYEESALSRITLALFEDSGWYKVNYYSGGLFKFGLKAGCKFFTDDCLSNQKSNFKDYCDKPGDKLCYSGRSAKGRCLILESTNEIPQQYRYFKNPYYGGREISNFCPVAGIFDNEYPGLYLGNSCITGEKNTLPNFLNEYIGVDSGCFVSSLTRKNNIEESDYYGKSLSICYKYECNHLSSTINVYIRSQTINCPTQGGDIEVDGYDGKFECPAYYQLCNQSIRCNSITDCIEKKSITVERERPSSTLIPKKINEPVFKRTCFRYECLNGKFTFYSNEQLPCPDKGCQFFGLDTALILCSDSDYDYCSLNFVCNSSSNCVYMILSAPIQQIDPVDTSNTSLPLVNNTWETINSTVDLGKQRINLNELFEILLIILIFC